ncbi:hypothetical protein ACFCZT_08030 [Streptomyces sp. NPDC056230]|uniref:hypothetical protein n=1 Tax=Streptomyces sp. NPDC056230 TaxID=3345754 RepID=UPI0035DC9FF1
MTKGKDAPQAITVVLQERLMSVVFTPTGSAAPQFDLRSRSLPYDRIPALVREATTTLGVRSPRARQLTADHLSGPLTIRVTVTGPNGAASLDADGAGKVVRRSPAR